MAPGRTCAPITRQPRSRSRLQARASGSTGSRISDMGKLCTLLLVWLLLLVTPAPAQVVGEVEPPSDAVSSGCGYDTRVCTWATRVVANGGAAPSAATEAALNTFVLGMDSTGLWAKMICVNCLVPDSLTA